MIISTKIQVPYVNTPLVQRQALIQRLHKGIKGKLTLVVAPAGYGKSTLLSKDRNLLFLRTHRYWPMASCEVANHENPG